MDAALQNRQWNIAHSLILAGCDINNIIGTCNPLAEACIERNHAFVNFLLQSELLSIEPSLKILCQPINMTSCLWLLNTLSPHHYTEDVCHLLIINILNQNSHPSLTMFNNVSIKLKKGCLNTALLKFGQITEDYLTSKYNNLNDVKMNWNLMNFLSVQKDSLSNEQSELFENFVQRLGDFHPKISI
ncbi:hypothetical protein [Legionella tunisiensis]|uniref:hypothetical protein n=1 Tax=Legionella tunisiensis TaxID=1034944 RepID=UPI000300312B|nr:hypothetical protein [Legionella tunisiensis]